MTAEIQDPVSIGAPFEGGFYGGKIRIAKLNVDENSATATKYGIRGIPTLMLFKGGNIEATKVGALSKSQLAAFIDSHL